MGQYSSHPVARLKLGRFQFERGVLVVHAEEEAEFDTLLASQPATIRGRVHKVSVDAAERVAASFKQSRMYAGIDTTMNTIQAADGQQGAAGLVPALVPPAPASVPAASGLIFGRPLAAPVADEPSA